MATYEELNAEKIRQRDAMLAKQTTESITPEVVQSVVPDVVPPTKPEDWSADQPVVMLDEQVGNLLSNASRVENIVHSYLASASMAAQQALAKLDNTILGQVNGRVGDAAQVVDSIDRTMGAQLAIQQDTIAENFTKVFGQGGGQLVGGAVGFGAADDAKPQFAPNKQKVVDFLVKVNGWDPAVAGQIDVAENLANRPFMDPQPEGMQWQELVDTPNGAKAKYGNAGDFPIGSGTFGDTAWCTPGYKLYRSRIGNPVACVWQGNNPTKPKPAPQPAEQPQPHPADEPQGSDREETPSGDCQKVYICNWPDDEPKKSDCKKWKVYRTSEGVCYVVGADSGPHNSGDTLVTEGEFQPSWIERIIKDCGKKAKPEDSEESQGETSESELKPFTAKDCLEGIDTTFVSGATFQGAIKSFLGMTHATDIGFAIGDWFKSPDSLVSGLLAGVAQSGVGGVGAKLDEIAASGQCNSSDVNKARIALTLQGLIRWLTPDAFADVVADINYFKNSKCQYLLPTASDAVSQFLANAIPSSELKCLVEANAHKWKWFAPNLEAARSKQTPLDLASLFRRRNISREEYDQRIRENGFLKSKDSQEILEVTKPLPGPADIVRFMLRDVVNRNVVERFRLDDGFDTNYRGSLKDYAEFQGLDDEQMQLYWRAHWSIPSPTQLYEMWRRLRHDPNGPGQEVLLADIKAALMQQDILPFWQDRLLKLATLPLNRTDSKRAFEINAIDKQQLLQSFYAGGYNDTDAQTLVDFTIKQKRLKFARHSAVKQYAMGLITRMQMTDLMTFEGAEQTDIDYALQRAKIISQANMRDKCASAVKRRYFLAEVDFQGVLERLTNLGIDQEIAGNLATAWQCERQSRGKALPLMRLTKLYQRGIIGADELTRRAVALGYDADTAIDILLEQDGIKAEENEKKRLLQAKKAAAEEEKRIKDNAKRQGEIERAFAKINQDAAKAAANVKAGEEKQKKESERLAAQAKSASKAASTVMADREDQLLSIAANQAKITGNSLGDSLRVARACFNSLKRTGKSVDSVLAIGVRASKLTANDTPEKFCEAWQAGVNASVGIGPPATGEESGV